MTDRPNPKIDPKFIIERQGKAMVLYAGLLHQAHLEGLSLIETKLLQVPSEDNGLTAICWARVRTERGEFCGIGDASPVNVNRMILSATIRMAETRAKARALRDACDIGMVAVEEVGPDDSDDFRQPRQEGPSAPMRETSDDMRQPRGAAPAQSSGPPMTEKQRSAIFAIGKAKHDLTQNEVIAHVGRMMEKKLDDLFTTEASKVIGRFNKEEPLPPLEADDDGPPF